MTGVEDELRRIKALLRQMTEHLDFVGPLPTPTEWTTREMDNVPGALWRMEFRLDSRYSDVSGRVEIIAAADDVGVDHASVFIRGLDIGNDMDAVSPAHARAFGRALIAAADMAGSPIIAERCRMIRKPVRVPMRASKPRKAMDAGGPDPLDDK